MCEQGLTSSSSTRVLLHSSAIFTRICMMSSFWCSVSVSQFSITCGSSGDLIDLRWALKTWLTEHWSLIVFFRLAIRWLMSLSGAMSQQYPALCAENLLWLRQHHYLQELSYPLTISFPMQWWPEVIGICDEFLLCHHYLGNYQSGHRSLPPTYWQQLGR